MLAGWCPRTPAAGRDSTQFCWSSTPVRRYARWLGGVLDRFNRDDADLMLVKDFDAPLGDYIVHQLPDIHCVLVASGLWVAMLGALLLIDGEQHSTESNPQYQFRLRLLIGFSVLLLLIALMLNPFRAPPSDAVSRPGLNALLQTDLMVIHPPLIFAFYTLCVGVGVHAISAMLFAGAPARDRILHLARPALFVGTLGVGLGGLWAYTVLDWGGYWAWDPVETGSILPWFALLLIIHARSTSNVSTSIKISPALGLISGLLAIHATLVTRANGVWASVHAFAADGLGTDSQDPYIRVMYIIDSSPIGFELASYVFAIILLGSFAIYFLFNQQMNDLRSENKKLLFEEKRVHSLILLTMLAVISVWIGSIAVLIIGISIMILLLTSDSSNPSLQWVFSGVILMFYASWSSSATIPQAIAGMSPFLIIWLISDDEDDWGDDDW